MINSRSSTAVTCNISSAVAIINGRFALRRASCSAPSCVVHHALAPGRGPKGQQSFPELPGRPPATSTHRRTPCQLSGRSPTSRQALAGSHWSYWVSLPLLGLLSLVVMRWLCKGLGPWGRAHQTLVRYFAGYS